jgi:hypothetical protein
LAERFGLLGVASITCTFLAPQGAPIGGPDSAQALACAAADFYSGLIDRGCQHPDRDNTGPGLWTRSRFGIRPIAPALHPHLNCGAFPLLSHYLDFLARSRVPRPTLSDQRSSIQSEPTKSILL